MENAADTLKKVTLECGGKSANIVLEDADLDMSIDGAIYMRLFIIRVNAVKAAQDCSFILMMTMKP